MPKGKVDLAYAFTLEPKDAVAYFRQKGYVIGWNWQDVAQQAHARAFTVAKAARLDILETIRKEVERAISQGVTSAEFIKTLKPRLQKLGWWGKQVIVDSKGRAELVQLGSPWRLRTIYRANVQSAYMAGRYKQQLTFSDTRPWWLYVAVMDENTRASHGALNNKVFRFDDPIWQSHYPPNGWGCRCRVRALSDRRLQSLGLAPQSSEGLLSQRTVETGFDKRTGEVYESEVTTFSQGKQTMTPDPGWSQNGGALVYGADVALLRKVTAVKELALRTQVVQSINNSALRHQAFAGWVDAVLDKQKAGHSVQAIGFMNEAVAAAVYNKTGKTPARVLVINEKQLVHADSKKHIQGGIALSRDELKALPMLMVSYDAVFWDRDHNNLMYVRFEGSSATVMMAWNPAHKTKRVSGRFDVMVNAFRVPDRRVLTNKGRFERLW